MKDLFTLSGQTCEGNERLIGQSCCIVSESGGSLTDKTTWCGSNREVFIPTNDVEMGQLQFWIVGIRGKKQKVIWNDP